MALQSDIFIPDFKTAEKTLLERVDAWERKNARHSRTRTS